MNKIAVDIFSGAGGLSIGAEMAGTTTILAVEYNEYAAKSFRNNHKNAKVLNEDIRKVNPLDHVEKHPFILIGGPPCQGFSISNTKTRNLDNPNNWMFKEYYRFLKDLEPEWFLFENVVGFKSFNNGKFAKNIESEFKQLGYTTCSTILSASDFGVPQSRSRFFIVGNKNGIVFDFNSLEKKSIVTVDEALSDLPKLDNGENRAICKYTKEADHPFLKQMRKLSKAPLQNTVSRNKDYVIERYKHIGHGENWSSVPKELMKSYKTKRENIHSGIYKRLDPKKPSIVIANYRKSMIIHPHQNRGLSLREAARLQSFPDHIVFEGPLSHKQQQIGNAVPPLLAKVIIDKMLKLSQ